VNASVDMLTPEQLRAKFPWLSTDGVVAGTLGVDGQGWFDPWSYLTALKRKSVALGVDVIQGEVKGFDLDDQANRIQRVLFDQKHGDGVIRKSIAADKVVNAAGPWASKLLEMCGSMDYPVRPRYGTARPSLAAGSPANI
jgi:FAD-dependent oxidoreductase domain-containing protein 1